MSRTSAFRRNSGGGNTDNNSPVFMKSKKVYEGGRLIPEQDSLLSNEESTSAANYSLLSFADHSFIMVRGILLSLILWKKQYCDLVSIQLFVSVHRNEDGNKLLHIETNNKLNFFGCHNVSSLRPSFSL